MSPFYPSFVPLAIFRHLQNQYYLGLPNTLVLVLITLMGVNPSDLKTDFFKFMILKLLE